MPQKAAPFLSAVFLLLPASVLACPTELGAGIVYTSDDGSTTTVTATDRPDVLHERVLFPEGDGYEVEALFGLFEVTTVDFDATGLQEDTRENSVFTVPPALPQPGETLTGIMAEVTNATESFPRRHDLQAGPLTEVDLGGCAYQGYQIELRLFQPDGPMVHQFVRVPSLGMAFYTGFEDQDGPESYPVTSIAPLPAVAPTK